MHSAPAVVYPVGRSHFQRRLLVSLVVLGFATCVIWASVVPEADWRQFLCAALVLTGGLNVWRTLQKSDTGPLKWDGQRWHWASAIEVVQCVPRLDLQFVMLLEIQVGARHSHWVWLDRTANPVQWLALRRAVYARPPKDPARLPDKLPSMNPDDEDGQRQIPGKMGA